MWRLGLVCGLRCRPSVGDTEGLVLRVGGDGGGWRLRPGWRRLASLVTSVWTEKLTHDIDLSLA
jgi:hypothetical protein